MSVRIITGDCRDVLRTLESESVNCVVTSPPYWGLRDYGVEPSIWDGNDSCEHTWGSPAISRDISMGNGRNNSTLDGGRETYDGTPKHARGSSNFCAICGAWRGAHGLEPSFDLFVAHEVLIFREVRRVLRSDGTLWLNLGDSYAGSWGNQGRKEDRGTQRPINGGMLTPVHDGRYPAKKSNTGKTPDGSGLKPKDLCGIPWRVAFALQADGWWLRQDIIWSKPNPMPESVTDRCSKAHEYLFMLSKSERYYYDADAIKESGSDRNGREKGRTREVPPRHQAYESSDRSSLDDVGRGMLRNKRSVWEIATAPFPQAHFATFPPALIEPCILAGCPPGGTVLDCFGGAGTTGLVADRLQRNAIIIELNPEYAAMADRRIRSDAPLFSRSIAAGKAERDGHGSESEGMPR